MNVIRIYTTAAGTLGRSIEAFDKDAAEAKLHEYQRNGITDPNIKATVCILMDDDGVVHKYDRWELKATETPVEPAE